MRFLLTADPGFEDVTLAELAERGLPGAPRPFGYAGLVVAEAPGPEPLFSLRSVHHLVQDLGRARLSGPGLEDALSALAPFAIPGLGPETSFAVRVHRRGRHAFQSPELERAYGAVLVARYRAPVNLTQPDLLVRVDLFEEALFLGIQLTRRPLSIRYPKVYAPPAALKASVAYGMLRRLGVSRETRLLDAFAGSGTLAIEAVQGFSLRRVVALDRNPRAVAGGRENARQAGVSEQIRFLQGDARKLRQLFPPARFDAVVANPPYGKRLGRSENLYRMYLEFFQEAKTVLKPGGVLGVLVLKRGWIDRIARQVGGWVLLERRVIELGGLYPGYFVFRSKG